MAPQVLQLIILKLVQLVYFNLSLMWWVLIRCLTIMLIMGQMYLVTTGDQET